jgi:hypothetical protein
VNDRVKFELLEEAAGRGAAEAIGRASGGAGALIVVRYEGEGYSFREDGWFNATEAAKRYGKEPAQWLRLPETAAYMAALERRYGKITYVKTSRARLDRGGGTWLHPKLAVAFARWLDIDFSVWCDEQIERILEGDVPAEVEDRRTTVRERMPLLEAAHHIFARTGMFYPQAYAAINAAAGSTSFGDMMTSQVARVLPPARRINAGIDTQGDWELLHVRKKELTIDTQLELGFTEHDQADKQ